MNWFIFSVGVLQIAGAVQYALTGKKMYCILYVLYAMTNFVLWYCKGE